MQAIAETAPTHTTCAEFYKLILVNPRESCCLQRHELNGGRVAEHCGGGHNAVVNQRHMVLNFAAATGAVHALLIAINVVALMLLEDFAHKGSMGRPDAPSKATVLLQKQEETAPVSDFRA